MNASSGNTTIKVTSWETLAGFSTRQMTDVLAYVYLTSDLM